MAPLFFSFRQREYGQRGLRKKAPPSRSSPKYSCCDLTVIIERTGRRRIPADRVGLLNYIQSRRHHNLATQH